MIDKQAIAPAGETLAYDIAAETLHAGLAGKFTNQRVLALIPDHTRTLPLPRLFRTLVSALHEAKQLDLMIALGTHPPLNEVEYFELLGITAEERAGEFHHVGLLNHDWDNPEALEQIAILPQDQIKELAEEIWHPTMGGDVPVTINKKIQDYDHILILGPTFPHEVVGFSGGAKYLFPGISGPDVINATHWLGALVGVMDTIGVKDTPVRRMIHAAACHIPIPITLAALVVQGQELAGVFVGDHESAWEAAADLSAKRHILWYDKPFQRVLSWAPPMYDELWTGAKAMYKLEPVIADGGEVIIYAPHLDTVSHVHGKFIYETGYHVLEYFLEQWDRFKHIPAGVLAHSTHVRGAGSYKDGIEQARIQVSLSSQVSRENTEKLALNYIDPVSIDPAEWQNREEDGILFVPKAGETLYKVRKHTVK